MFQVDRGKTFAKSFKEFVGNAFQGKGYLESNNLKKYLYIPESNDPDLIIRTGGERRLSNFMLWQSAYAELYFTKVLWPDFKIRNLDRALDDYIKRKRKFGR